MATLTVCDGGCGKKSPDDAGKHIGNAWFDVAVTRRDTIRPRLSARDMVFCPDCWARLTKDRPR